ncbi:hypothetical protein SKAU_G00031010 [Synaphobranchus kaupii]|uniref:Uncharacterized protein n=1 Tax=Synaphobranchus kaupii TaxID=118154 RepID=A0A9Q1GEX6_SYNKA|nr:hypothetical protein SKAU_G00031010 [Synaphobranchus kaupii]
MSQHALHAVATALINSEVPGEEVGLRWLPAHDEHPAALPKSSHLRSPVRLRPSLDPPTDPRLAPSVPRYATDKRTRLRFNLQGLISMRAINDQPTSSHTHIELLDRSGGTSNGWTRLLKLTQLSMVLKPYRSRTFTAEQQQATGG